jgi:hypothetical protein
MVMAEINQTVRRFGLWHVGFGQCYRRALASMVAPPQHLPATISSWVPNLPATTAASLALQDLPGTTTTTTTTAYSSSIQDLPATTAASLAFQDLPVTTTTTTASSSSIQHLPATTTITAAHLTGDLPAANLFSGR